MMRVTLLISTGYLLVAELPPSYATDCYRNKGNDNSYWSWRIIDGARCWYRGRPGRPKTELHWASVDDTPSSVAERDRVYPDHDPAPVPLSVPTVEPEPVAPTAAPWRASDEDMLLALTCCWPELEPQPAPPSTAPFIPMTSPPHSWLWAAGLLVAYALYRLFGLNLIRGGLHG